VGSKQFNVKNILVIGVGLHFEQNHLPALLLEMASRRVGTVVGFDLAGAQQDVQRLLSRIPVSIPVHYAERAGLDPLALPPATVSQLDRLTAHYCVDAVIVACEPTFHARYARWAISRGLSLLLDKPVTLRADCANSEEQSRAILSDFETLAESLTEARGSTPDIFAQVMCQRRFHPVYQTARGLVDEVRRETDCPITSIQSFHSDGQWRLPNELVDINYHSFNRGYGKLGHSGYHFIDLMAWLLKTSWGDRPADQLRLVSQGSRPLDFLAQLPPDSYRRYLDQVPFSSQEVRERISPALERHGEIDAFTNLSFRRRGRVITLGSLNLVHNGFSMRHRAASNLADLYRGNGRVRHESHIIEQGPFQAMHIHSYRSGDESRNPSQVGGRSHLDLHVFRNSNLSKGWSNYEQITAETLSGGGPATDVQREGRSRAIRSFCARLDGQSQPEVVSDLEDHRLGCTMLAASFTSLAREANGQSPVVDQELVP
jgi:predicted dehydrogenase